MSIDLPDIKSREEFTLDEASRYVKQKDYFRSGIAIMQRRGYTFSRGINAVVRGEIPISAGTSSSSAVVVAWMTFLSRMSDNANTLTPQEIGKLAFQAEVEEFDEAGGMMDQLSSSIGGMLLVEFFPNLKVEKLDGRLKTFVLGDSLQAKNTQEVLSRVKNRVLQIVEKLTSSHPDFSLQTAEVDNVDRLSRHLSREEQELLRATIRNRDLTREGTRLLGQQTPDDFQLGKLLNEQQSILGDVLKISTPKIDAMLNAALTNGALGGKINGSGGGGCMFVYAPEDPKKVARAIEGAGGRAFVIQCDNGARVESEERIS